MSNPHFIDWKKIHQRIETARLLVERGATPDREKTKTILRARAETLAKETEAETGDERIELIEFLLAHERYGIEASYVREVFPLKEFTALPGTPAFILGIINVRGQIVSVVDIKKFFDLPEKGITDLNKVIIIQNAAMEFGILADAVPGVSFVSLSELQPPPPTFTGVRLDYLRGLTSKGMPVLDAGKLLSDPKLVIQEEVEASANNNYESHT